MEKSSLPEDDVLIAKKKKWLSRNLIVLSLVSFFQDAASEMLYPILPIFLTSILGAPVAVVGVIEGLAEGVSSIIKFASGRLSDRMSKRRLVGTGYGLASLAKMLIAIAYSWPLVLIARVIDRTGKGIRSVPRDALIANDTEQKYFGRAFGFHRAMDTAGAVVGPLLGLGLYIALDHKIRPLLYIAVIPAVISALLVFFVREKKIVKPGAVAQGADNSAEIKFPKRYWHVVSVMTLFSLVNFPDALLLLRAKYLGFSTVGVIGLYIVYNAVYSLLSYPAGFLSDHWPRKIVVAIGVFVFAISYFSLGIVHEHIFVWIIFTLYGAFTAFTDGVSKAWISDFAPKETRGRALGYYQGLTGVASIGAGAWAGFAWNNTGSLPLMISGVVAMIVGLIIMFTTNTSALI